MSGEASITFAAADQDASIFGLMRTRTAKTVASVSMIAMAAAGCSSSHKSSGEHNAASTSAVAACDTLEFANAAADATKYDSTAFFPHAPLDSSDHVKNYVLGLFDKDGPLGGKADAASLALINATVTEPAQDQKVFDPNRSIAEAFDRKMSEYNGTNGVEAAKQDCATTDKVLVQVSGYNKNWAEKGDKVVTVTAERDAQNRITSVKLVNGIAGTALSGDEMVLRDSTKGYDGFGDYLIDDQGNLYLKGALKENQQSQNHEQQQAAAPTPTPSPENGSNNQSQKGASGTEQQQTKGGSSKGTNGTSSTGKGESGGQCHNCGGTGCTSCTGGGGNVGPSTGPSPGPTGPGGGGTTTPTPGPTGPGGGETPTPTPTHSQPSTTPTPTPTPTAPKSPAPTDCPGC